MMESDVSRMGRTGQEYQGWQRLRAFEEMSVIAETEVLGAHACGKAHVLPSSCPERLLQDLQTTHSALHQIPVQTLAQTIELG